MDLGLLADHQDGQHLETALSHYREARADLDTLAESGPHSNIIHPQYVTRVVSELAADDAIFTCDAGCDLKNPDFAQMANAIGVEGIRVERPQELRSAVQAILAHPGPALLDVVSARQELIMPPKTTTGEAVHFGMFLLKAVLDGRARELVDLAKVASDH